MFLNTLLPLARPSVFPMRPDFYLHDLDQSAVKLLFATLSLLNCHKLPNVSK